MKFSALVIGLGKIGLEYDENIFFTEDKPESSVKILTHSRAISCHPGFNLEGGIDLDIEKRKKFEKIYKIKAFKNLEEYTFNKSNKIDLLVISVSTESNLEIIKRSLEVLKPRIILLEKPLSISFFEAKKIKSLLKKYPEVKIAVNYIRRYLLSTNYWLEKIKSKVLGKFIFGNIFYGKGLLSNGSHFVNLAEYWLGELKFVKYFDLGKSYLDFDKEISCQLVSVKNSHAPLMVNSVGGSGIRCGELDLWFEGGRLKWENNDTSIKFFKRTFKNSDEGYCKIENNYQIMDIEIDKYQFEVMNCLYSFLKEGCSDFIKCNLEEALQTLHLIDFNK